jgi:hypothetical protein
VDDRSDGLIRVLDLFHYVAAEVAKSLDSQNPVLTTRTQDNFPIALRKGGILKSEETSSSDGRTGKNPPSERDLEDLMVSLYPQGPTDSEIWSRAGGELASLRLGSTGRAAWHAALRTLSLGGGGAITVDNLLRAVATEFGNNQQLRRLLEG